VADPAVRVLPESTCARKIVVTGHVQGVGFRPFVYRLAREHGLHGSVRNQLGQVEIRACGVPHSVRKFEHDLVHRAPPLSRPRIEQSGDIDSFAGLEFEILQSAATAEARVFVPPDYFLCDECRAELHDPGDRRFRYPFINCTQCGPRYTLINALPYDRVNTSMAGFVLCPDCNREYRDPADRRFHAEPIACPSCGPQLSFLDTRSDRALAGDGALVTALTRLKHGAIVAVKGIGGYHLMCDARNLAAVTTLRQRKFRPDKPLAVMFPLAGQDGLDTVRDYATLDNGEAELLASPARPIVLVTRREPCDLAINISAGLTEIGAFLPYSPLHQLLLEGFGGPLVATSGNISGEPVLTDNDEAEARLGNIADGFLHHDRPIVRPADDPVYRRIAGRARPLRVGRGCAPVELQLPWWQPQPLLAVGGHMKGTVALSWDDRVVVSPHIGEMDSPRSLRVFEKVARDLQALYDIRAERIVCDAHPGYTTHRWAGAQDVPVDYVWHHRAHASAVAAESDRGGTWLTFAWDGVGLGEDGTLWGGEALLGTAGRWRRVASFRPFRLPGGDKAGREPWRSAAALQWTCNRDWLASPDQDGLAHAAWRREVNSPATSAAGRLFDAAAALIGRFHFASFEAQGPMYLESLVVRPAEPVPMPLQQAEDGVWRTDWEPLLDMMGDDSRSQRARAEVFHSSMAAAMLAQARQVRQTHDVDQVGLCGGVFQNRALTEQATQLLGDDGFEVVLPVALPFNDAALSFGQAAEVAALAAARRI
jgi:hydrogenase maturation protein HypF